MDEHQNRPAAALGQTPDGQPPEDDPDFAGEHDDTAVSHDIIEGTDRDREPETPRGWSGMEKPGFTAD
ncbi:MULTISPECIES: hypothetical protein [Micromonosporaceae]|uniref:hypothetical protein n=1 Tax=Micromonosporaceae TaxID=28056 RepID=UPI000F48AF1D|nr:MULTISPECIES: hypothetical protein [Micromonosporaceae]ROO58493.1 hypothetical protein EDC02_0253 [Micromonospora sp. Llam0]WBB98348.1 hypothetical protein O7553_05310 [Solwaraspora sp. WMMA2059]WBC23099.1 hypothetical protein O7543_12055 [Solwaraspora sp. WMMA2080]WJK34834.1 hypothetical protein O7610_30470 [Solwaraspora sp. WMMA2065]WJK34866.1 hypothetical protein O7610_00155 [Solwaraspora sp. WMMA2065]